MLSCNNNISWDYIKNNPELPWDYQYMASSEKINMQIILDNQELFCNYSKYFSINPSLSAEKIIENGEYQWDWSIISKNLSIDINKFNYDKLMKMDFSRFGYNKFLRLDFIERQENNKFNFNEIIANSFEYDKRLYVRKCTNNELNKIFRKKICSGALLIITDFLI